MILGLAASSGRIRLVDPDVISRYSQRFNEKFMPPLVFEEKDQSGLTE
jgi:hypothetical protein